MRYLKQSQEFTRQGALVRCRPRGTILFGKNDQFTHIALSPAFGLNLGVIF